MNSGGIGGCGCSDEGAGGGGGGIDEDSTGSEGRREGDVFDDGPRR